MLNKYLTAAEIAEILQISYENALMFIKHSGVRFVKIGRCYRVAPADLTKFLEKEKSKLK